MDSTDKQSGFDQKAFLQLRLHTLLERINKFNENPLFFNPEFNCRNYQLVFQDLCSVLQTIYSKLTSDEKQKSRSARETLKEQIGLPVFLKKQDAFLQEVRGFSNDNWVKIYDGLFNFRCLLEDMMDAHGFNPSKDDLSKSIIKM